jgi:hypothetical protein
MWAPPPHGSHVIKTACQNHLMVKNERFQELDGQRFLVFWFDGQNQTSIIVQWPKIDFFLTRIGSFFVIRVRKHNNLIRGMRQIKHC